MKKTQVFAALMVFLGAGCVDDRQTLLFTEICGNPTPTGADACSYPATCSTFEGDGRLLFDAEGMSTAGDAELLMQIEFENQLPFLEDEDTGLLDGNDATIEGFRLTYTVISGTATLPFSGDVFFPQTFVVDSEGTLAPLVYVVPYTVGASLATLTGASFDMRVDMRARGHYKNGHEFEVGPFPVIVEVRNGAGPWGATCTAPEVSACCGGTHANYQSSTCACVTP